jgi:hypothetical protein
LALNLIIVSLEDEMKGKTLISALALVAALPTGAWAATVTGRITYTDLNNHRLMLDNSDMYAVAPEVAPTGLEVGRLVTVDATNRGSEKVITKVLKYN